jgi:hypothetical protein
VTLQRSLYTAQALALSACKDMSTRQFFLMTFTVCCCCIPCTQVLALSPWVPLHQLPDKAAYDKIVAGLLWVRCLPDT